MPFTLGIGKFGIRATMSWIAYLKKFFLANSSDRFTNLEFRIYEFLNEYLLWLWTGKLRKDYFGFVTA